MSLRRFEDVSVGDELPTRVVTLTRGNLVNYAPTKLANYQQGELSAVLAYPRLWLEPAYLARFGTPRHPDDLRQHRLLANSASPQINRWPLPGKEMQRGELQVQGHTRTDNSAVMVSLVQHGVGIARLMDLLARPLVQSGALVPLLQDSMAGPRMAIYAVMPRQRQRLPKIRACIDHWSQWLAEMATR